MSLAEQELVAIHEKLNEQLKTTYSFLPATKLNEYLSSHLTYFHKTIS